MQKLGNKIAEMQIAFDTLLEERRSLEDTQRPAQATGGAQDASVVSHQFDI